MKRYAIASGSKLVFSVDSAPWETVTFQDADFENSGNATAEELATILNHSGSLACSVDVDGALLLATASRGDTAALEIDLPNSTAASPLGLAARSAVAHGSGLSPAHLIGQATEPFAVHPGASMSIEVDGTRSQVLFDGLAGSASAQDVVQSIGKELPGVARARRDGRVTLVSPTVGPDSSLQVEPGETAAALGFIGMSAYSRPIHCDPARLVCSGTLPGLRLLNLTSSPIQIHLATGSLTLPASGSAPIGPADAGHGHLQRMIARGIIRLAQED